MARLNKIRLMSSAAVMAGLVFAASAPSEAAESAKGFYLLGSAASLAAMVPPPGTYLIDYNYYYTGNASGRAGAGVILNEGGAQLDINADVDVDADIYINIPTMLWVAPRKVLDGNFGVGVLIPIGWQDISADVNVLADLTLPNGNTFTAGQRFSLSDDTFAFGDPVLMAMLGWTRGKWAWKLGTLLNVPIGSYDVDDIANMGFNRWGLDTSAAATWFDPTIGLEFSTNAGFTFNGKNLDKDYKTGTEFHVEFAATQFFSKQFAVGIAGYHYQQITGDSGSDANLGDFKGRVTAIGPTLTYNTQIRSTPISTSFRWYHEFNAENRLEGDAVYLQATMPLGRPAQ